MKNGLAVSDGKVLDLRRLGEAVGLEHPRLSFSTVVALIEVDMEHRRIKKFRRGVVHRLVFDINKIE